jgi:hypothetical protein
VPPNTGAAGTPKTGFGCGWEEGVENPRDIVGAPPKPEVVDVAAPNIDVVVCAAGAPNTFMGAVEAAPKRFGVAAEPKTLEGVEVAVEATAEAPKTEGAAPPKGEDAFGWIPGSVG